MTPRPNVHVLRSVFKPVARAGRTVIRCLSLSAVDASTLARDISERKRRWLTPRSSFYYLSLAGQWDN